jgi:xylulokinase
MATSALVGVDIGTSSAKGIAHDTDGRALATVEIAYRHDTPQRGWAEADAGAWWTATCRILRSLVDTVRPAQIDAVTVTGQAPTLLVVDRDGRPLRPAILWLDVRSEGEVDALAARAGPDGERIAGNRFHAYYLGPKLAWLRHHEPGLFERPLTILQSHSYPVLRLTGARVTDYSSAALCAPLYDCRARAWSAETCARLGVETSWLPEIKPSHAIAGRVTAAAARETGLREGTPVAVGGADFAASTLAAGVTEPGEACLMLGTAGNLIMPLASPDFDTRLINSHHVGCDRYLALGGTLSGALQEWFRSVTAPGTAFETLDAEAAAVPPGADGLRLLPYLQGERTPVWDAGACGAFVGLSLVHGRGHLYRAVLEGVAVSFRHCAEIAAEKGMRLREVIAVNGGARSAVWRQILCDALGVPLLYAPEGGGAPTGGALLGGIAVGLLDGVQAARRWRRALVPHAPDAGRTATYAALLAGRRELYPAVRRIA